MKKVNLLSKAEMKKVSGGNPPISGDDCTMLCRDSNAKLLHEVPDVICESKYFDTYCADVEGYDKSRSTCGCI